MLDSGQDWVRKAVAWFGVIVAGILIFNNLGNGSIDLWDEAITAGRSLYIYNTHNIINLQVNGEISVRKPFLIYLLNSFMFHIVGINEFGLRFFNAFWGFSIYVILTFIALKIIDLKYAWSSSWLLLGAFKLINFSREALTDTIFTFGILLSIISIILLCISQNRWLYLFYMLGLFLSLFGKGPAALIILPISFLSILLIKDRTLVKPISLYSFFPLILFCIWFFFQMANYKDFINVFIFQEYIQRFNYNSQFLSSSIHTPFYYLSHLWYFFRFTGYLGLISIIYWCYLLYFKKDSCIFTFKVYSIISCSFLVYFLLISIASHKCSRYFLPLYPLLVLGLLCLFCCLPLQYKLKQLLLVIAIIIGLFTTHAHYKSVPNYLPTWKQLAIEAISKSKERKILSFCSNDSWFALILHFYSNQIVRVPCTNDTNTVHVIVQREGKKITNSIIR